MTPTTARAATGGCSGTISRRTLPLFVRYLSNLADSGYAFDRALLPHLSRYVRENSSPDRFVLDFGCGMKPWEYLFEGFAGVYQGIDVYPGSRVDIVYDGADIPLPSNSVDLVFSSSVFEHVCDIEHTLHQLHRVLKPGGRLIAVVPFMNHCHGTPFDYHRPTRFGWEALLRRVFGAGARVSVRPVDGRVNCLVNLLTAQMNLVLLDVMRKAKDRWQHRGVGPALEAGGASPESRNGSGMKIPYAVVRLNPINFVLGLVAWLCSLLPVPRRYEGEITSGYLIQVTMCE